MRSVEVPERTNRANGDIESTVALLAVMKRILYQFCSFWLNCSRLPVRIVYLRDITRLNGTLE